MGKAKETSVKKGSLKIVSPESDGDLIPLSLPATADCVADIRDIIVRARTSVVRHVNTIMPLAYWLIGRRIVVEEQKGKDRAAYGERLLERISRELTTTLGDGFGEPHLRNCRLFYRAYPTEEEIRYTLCIKLSWSHHRAIMRVSDPKARAWYLNEAAAAGWKVKELERQIRLCAYERLQEKAAVPAIPQGAAEPVTPAMLLKDPCVAEFLNMKGNLRGKEKKLEKRILDNLQKFMLELGRGFTLAGRQYRIPTETSERYVDLVFYNYILHCFVLVDLKTSKLTSRDIGQMDAYRRMFDTLKRPEGDNPTVGILLGTEIDETDVKYSVMADCERLFATKLMPYMPSRDELKTEIERSRLRAAAQTARKRLLPAAPSSKEKRS